MSDESWRPLAGPDVAASRATLLTRARNFFAEREILEVDTPAIAKFPVTDPHIESFSLNSAAGADFYLHTSPEYKMKQLLAAGFGDIYQICKVFRDGERGPHHLREFTLVEWYRLDFCLREIMDDTIEFIATVLGRPELSTQAEFASYEDVFKRTVDVNPRTADVEELAHCVNADQTLKDALGDDRDAWLDLVLAQEIVPQLGRERLTIVHHYPSSQAALARICLDNDEVADRFEVFYGRHELANGFVELRDADEQYHRFENDQETRRRNHAADREIDTDLISALRAGLPACAGVAVGFDRLLMLHEDQDDISAVSSFIV